MSIGIKLKQLFGNIKDSKFGQLVSNVYNYLSSKKWVRFVFFMYIVAFTMFAYTLVRNQFTIPIGGDFTLQEIPFYFNGYDDWWHALTTGEFVMWDDSGFLGVNNIGANSFYYLFNPFFLVLLLVPRSIMPQAQAFMMITKIVLAGVSMKLLLEKFKLKEETTWLFAVAYAFCGWNLYYLWFNHFLEIAVLMPLVLLGIEYIIKDRKPVLLAIIIFISGLTNYFFLICFCFCGVIYAGFRFFQNWKEYSLIMKEKKEANEIVLDVRIQVILQGIFAFAVGLMLACVILLPCFSVALSTPRAASSNYIEELVELLKQFKTSFSEGGVLESFTNVWNYLFKWSGADGQKYVLYPLIGFLTPTTSCFDSTIFNNVYYDNTYASMFLYTPILLFFVPSIISALRRKKISVIVGLLGMGFLLFTPFAYYCFSGFTSVAYGRWYIFVAAIAVVFIANEYDHRQEMSRWYLDVSFGVIICLYAYLLYKGQVIYTNNEVSNLQEMDQAVYYAYGEMVYLLIQYLYLRKHFKKPDLSNSLRYFVAFEAIVMCNITLIGQGVVTYSNLYQGIDNIQEEMKLCQTIMEEDKSYYRVFSTTCDRDGNNLAMMLGTPGVGTFHSIYNFESQDFIDWSTISYNGTWSMGVHEKRINLDEFIGVKYYILKQGDTNIPFGFTEYMTTDTHIVYINDNFIEMGYAFDEVFQESLLTTDSSKSVQNENAYLRGAILTKEDIEELELDTNSHFTIHNSTSQRDKDLYTVDMSDTDVKLYRAIWEVNPDTQVEEFKGHEEPISYSYANTKGLKWDSYMSVNLKSYNVANNASKDNRAYVTVRGRMGENLNVTLYSEDQNGNEYVLTSDKHMTHWYTGKEYDRKQLRGFYVDNRVTRVEVRLYDTLSNAQWLYKPTITYQYENTYLDRINKLKENPLLNIEKTANTVSFDTNFASPKMVVLQIPYESGWSVTKTDANGEITTPKVYKSHGGFVSFYAEAGESHYYVSYQTPYLTEGIRLMSAGLMCLGCYSIANLILSTKKKKYKKLETKMN